MNNSENDYDKESLSDEELEATFHVIECEELFELTKNQVFVWDAINICMNAKQVVPDWVLSELHKVSERMMLATSQNKEDKNLLSILGLSTRKDFSLYNKKKKENSIFREIEALLKATEGDYCMRTDSEINSQMIGFSTLKGDKLGDNSAFKSLAQKHNLSEKRIEQIYEEGKKHYYR